MKAVEVYLVGNHGKTYGTVEIVYNNTRGTICDDIWRHEEAAVICRMLGLPTQVSCVHLSNLVKKYETLIRGAD